MPPSPLHAVAAEARACTLCAERLPLGPRPVFRVSATARLLIVGQAPGTRVHATGIPWNDASGERLRAWLAVTPAEFYNESLVAIVPMGFCYPGVLPNGGDRPPEKQCAPTWHPRLLPLMPDVALTLVIGGYAMARLLGKASVTDWVRRYRETGPSRFPLPHPSWRTGAWERRNPWFGAEILPELRARVRQTLAGE